MEERTNFVVYCIEEYKAAKGLSGKSVIEFFNYYNGFLTSVDVIFRYHADID